MRMRREYPSPPRHTRGRAAGCSRLRGAAPPYLQAVRYDDVEWGDAVVGAVDAVGEALQGAFGELLFVGGDGGEGGLGVAAVLDVVEADDGQVLGDAQAAFVGDVECAQREFVGEREDGVARECPFSFLN